MNEGPQFRKKATLFNPFERLECDHVDSLLLGDRYEDVAGFKIHFHDLFSVCVIESRVARLQGLYSKLVFRRLPVGLELEVGSLFGAGYLHLWVFLLQSGQIGFGHVGLVCSQHIEDDSSQDTSQKHWDDFGKRLHETSLAALFGNASPVFMYR